MLSTYPDTAPITLRQLAAHLSGLPKDFPYPYFDTLEFPPIDQLLPDLPTAQVAFPPQWTTHYSNMGYALLGHALERAAQQPYRSYVVDHILRPLGMQQSGFAPQEAPDLATGYFPAPDGQSLLPAPLLEEEGGATAPAGALNASVEDMARFVSLQFAIGPAQGSQILNGTTIREMHAPAWIDPDWERGIGIGWWLKHVDKHTEISHPGGDPGFNADVRIIPDLKLGLVICINTATDTRSIMRQALDLLLPAFAPETLWPFPPSITHGSRYAGHYAAAITTLDVWLEDDRLMGQFAGDDPFVFYPNGTHQFQMQGGFLLGEQAYFDMDEDGHVRRVRFNGFSLKPQ